jgi:hypothetical protein
MLNDMTTFEMQEFLAEVLSEREEIDAAVTYEECGMLTRDKGLVVSTVSGVEFQITIVRTSRDDSFLD